MVLIKPEGLDDGLARFSRHSQTLIVDIMFSVKAAQVSRRFRHWLPCGPIGRSGPPNQNHARLHLACINLFIFYGIYLERPSGDWAGKSLLVIIPTVNGRGASAGAGAGRAYRVAPSRGRSGEVCHGRYGDSRTWAAELERSASTHATRVQYGKQCM
eukprot:6189347-Pleurochrysis_carterae.AAC.1